MIPINSHQLFDICTLLLVHSRLSSYTINTTTSSANSSLPPSSSHTSFRKSSTLSSTPPTEISNRVGNRLWHQGLDPQDPPLRQIFAKERNLASAASSFAAHHESLHSQAGTRHIILAREQPIATTSPPSPHHRGKGLERGLDSSHLFQTSWSHLSVSGLGRPERLVIATSTDASSYDPQLRSALLCFSFLEGLVLPLLYSYNLYSRSALLSFFLLRGVRPPPSTFLQPSAPLRSAPLLLLPS